MTVATRRIFVVLFASVLTPVLMASSCTDDDEPSDASDPEAVPEVDVLPVDSGEPDPGLGEGGVELDGPTAPQEGDGSLPDEPSFEPTEEDVEE